MDNSKQEEKPKMAGLNVFGYRVPLWLLVLVVVVVVVLVADKYGYMPVCIFDQPRSITVMPRSYEMPAAAPTISEVMRPVLGNSASLRD